MVLQAFHSHCILPIFLCLILQWLNELIYFVENIWMNYEINMCWEADQILKNTEYLTREIVMLQVMYYLCYNFGWLVIFIQKYVLQEDLGLELVLVLDLSLNFKKHFQRLHKKCKMTSFISHFTWELVYCKTCHTCKIIN